MPAPRIRVLVAEDYADFRHFIVTAVQSRAELQVICEVADGAEAVQKALEFQPELILLDIGLPGLNGIEAARQIRILSPNSKILFVSENHFLDVIEEALRTGALGFVAKSNAASDLLSAVDAVLQGKEFVSASVSVQLDRYRRDEQTGDHVSGIKIAKLPLHNAEIVRDHEVVFYSEDRQLLDRLSQFIADALKAGNAAIVVATESHRDSLLLRLQAYGSDIRTAIEEGRYIPFDAAEALSTFMLNDTPDRVRFLKLLGDLMTTAAQNAKGGRVAVFGECVDLLSEQGKTEAVIRLEHLWNEISKSCDIDILCGYHLGNVQGGMDSHAFQRICAQHSVVL